MKHEAHCRRGFGCRYLVVQSSYLLLAGCREQEGVHLGLQRVIHLHIDVIARSLLLVVRVHAVSKNNSEFTSWIILKLLRKRRSLPDHMVDDDGVWWHQERVQSLRDLGKLHSLSLKDLQVLDYFSQAEAKILL